MTFTVKYQLNGSDAMECLRAHDPAFRGRAVLSLLASAGVVLMGAIWLVLPGDDDTLAWMSIGGGGILLLFFPVQQAYLAHQLRRQWDQAEPMELIVGEAGFVAKTRGSTTEVAWSRFHRVKEAQHHFLLYSSKDLYSVVPKRGFANQLDQEAFRTFAGRTIATP